MLQAIAEGLSRLGGRLTPKDSAAVGVELITPALQSLHQLVTSSGGACTCAHTSAHMDTHRYIRVHARSHTYTHAHTHACACAHNVCACSLSLTSKFVVRAGEQPTEEQRNTAAEEVAVLATIFQCYEHKSGPPPASLQFVMPNLARNTLWAVCIHRYCCDFIGNHFITGQSNPQTPKLRSCTPNQISPKKPSITHLCSYIHTPSWTSKYIIYLPQFGVVLARSGGNA